MANTTTAISRDEVQRPIVAAQIPESAGAVPSALRYSPMQAPLPNDSTIVEVRMGACAPRCRLTRVTATAAIRMPGAYDVRRSPAPGPGDRDRADITAVSGDTAHRPRLGTTRQGMEIAPTTAARPRAGLDRVWPGGGTKHSDRGMATTSSAVAPTFREPMPPR
jgi:hypothetical protein